MSVVLLVGAFLIVPASPATAAPYCGLVWGSLEKSAPGLSQAPVVNVRTGQHSCYDRLVIDVAGDVGGYTVALRARSWSRTAPGSSIPTRGGAALQITVNDPSYDRGRHADLLPGEPDRAAERLGLPHLPPGRVRRHLRGVHERRAGRPGAAAVPGVHARRPRHVVPSGGGRRAPLVISAQQPAHDRRGGLGGDAVVGAAGHDDVPGVREQRGQRGRGLRQAGPRLRRR